MVVLCLAVGSSFESRLRGPAGEAGKMAGSEQRHASQVTLLNLPMRARGKISSQTVLCNLQSVRESVLLRALPRYKKHFPFVL